MSTKSYSVHVQASPEAVFDYVSDVMRHPEWAHERIEMQRGQAGGADSGSTFSYCVHFMGEIRGTLRVIESRRPSRFVYECEDPTGLYRWTFAMAPEGTGARLTHELEFVRTSLRVTLTKSVMLPLVGNRMVTGGLENIKRHVEAPVAASA